MGPQFARHCCRRPSVGRVGDRFQALLAPLTGQPRPSPQVVRNKRPFGPPAAVKGFTAKRSFGAWLPSSPAASGPVRSPPLDHLTFLQAHKVKSICVTFGQFSFTTF